MIGKDMRLDRFCEGIRLMPEAVKELESIEVEEEEYKKNKRLFQEDKDAFYAAILKEKKFRLLFLYYFCRMGCDAWEEYIKKGISEKVYWDTFYDLTLWCGNCRQEYGEYGIAQYDWFYRAIEGKLLRLGRLEFEQGCSEWEFVCRGRKVSLGEQVIYVHVPQGERLEWKECLESFARAFRLWGKDRCYLCHSWLLGEELEDILPEESNIRKFREFFTVVRIDYEEREAEWRVFRTVNRSIKAYPEETALQKRMKKLLLEGKCFGNGLGVWKNGRNVR